MSIQLRVYDELFELDRLGHYLVRSLYRFYSSSLILNTYLDRAIIPNHGVGISRFSLVLSSIWPRENQSPYDLLRCP